jgi:uncharacterized protein (TIGR02271 family)
MPEASPDRDEIAVPLRAEELVVSRRKVEGEVVRVATLTREREQQIDEELRRDRVEITRVPIGRRVESAPPVREEGDVTIMPVVEEIVVVERQLILKEEIHIRQLRTTERHRQTVVLRQQDAVITRGEAEILADESVPDPREYPNTLPAGEQK